MAQEINLRRVQLKSDEAVVSAIARATATPVDQVIALYEENLATLAERATVRQFVGVIATNV